MVMQKVIKNVSGPIEIPVRLTIDVRVLGNIAAPVTETSAKQERKHQRQISDLKREIELLKECCRDLNQHRPYDEIIELPF